MTVRLAPIRLLAGWLAFFPFPFALAQEKSAPKAENKPDLKAALAKEFLAADTALREVQAFVEPRIAVLPKAGSAAEWETIADRLRKDVLDKVVFRGEGARWRDAQCRVVISGDVDVPAGAGYRIFKLRYEALPGMWIPALLYIPDKLTGPAPVMMNVNGHDGAGNAALYKQIRAINLAKRGVIVLNVEWFGMGQLKGPGFGHYRMNQLDLCGTGGLAPFHLAMKRGLDVLLSTNNADPKRVAVSGLSGGGWQTIFISALDTRVTLANPVAGYSSFLTRIKHFKDLGDSEQTPSDLAALADYTHLTAMLAPRALLLTYNSKDNCCFESGYALPPLVEAARPVFGLFGKEPSLRSHINHDPGDHNFGLDNRQALYRMMGDHFFAGNAKYDPKEIGVELETRKAEQLALPLPEKNADFSVLAAGLAAKLPRNPDLPTTRAAAAAWREKSLAKLREIVRAPGAPTVMAEQAGEEALGELKVARYRLKIGKDWTVPAVVFTRGSPRETAVIVTDVGRAGAPAHVARLTAAGVRVVAIDPFYFGESKLGKRDFLFALLVASVGERPLGIQAGQVAATARWARDEFRGGPVTLVTDGPRSSVIGLVAAALETDAIGRVEAHRPMGSLKELIEQGGAVDKTPELFCFGLLEHFDVRQVAALIAPRPLSAVEPSDRVKLEWAPLRSYYGVLHDPLP